MSTVRFEIPGTEVGMVVETPEEMGIGMAGERGPGAILIEGTGIIVTTHLSPKRSL